MCTHRAWSTSLTCRPVPFGSRFRILRFIARIGRSAHIDRVGNLIVLERGNQCTQTAVAVADGVDRDGLGHVVLHLVYMVNGKYGRSSNGNGVDGTADAAT